MTCEDPAKIEAWIAAKWAEAGAESEAEVEETTGEHDGVGYRCVEQLCRATRGKQMLVGAPLAALQSLIAPAASLAADARVTAALTGVRLDGMVMYGDLARAIAALYASDEMRQDPDTLKMLTALGLDSLDTLTIAQTVDGAAFRSKVALRYRPDEAGMLGALLDYEQPELTLDGFLPAAGMVTAYGALPNLGDTFDKVVAALRTVMDPEQAASMDQALASMPMTLGFDLRNDLLATLGGEYGVSYDFDFSKLTDVEDPTAALGAVRYQLVLGTTDQAKLEALLARYEPMAQGAGVPLETTVLGDGKLRSVALPFGGGMKAGLALADGKLVITTHADQVAAQYAGTEPTLASLAGYKQLREQFRDDATAVGYSEPSSRLIAQIFDIAGPNFIAAVGRGKQKRTMADLRTVGASVESYRVDNGHLPRAGSLAELTPLLQPTFVKKLPTADAWGKPLNYFKNDDGYVIWSRGTDGSDDADWKACATGCPQFHGETANDKADIVYANGELIRYPSAEAGESDAAAMPASMRELRDTLMARLDDLPPTMTVVKLSPGVVEYESSSAFDVGVVPGVVAAIAIPNMLNAIQRGKQKRTMSDMRTFGTAVESFNLDHHAYPVGTSPGDVAGVLAPTYVKRLPTEDGWQNQLYFRSDGKRYLIVSAGKDKEWERAWSSCMGGCPGLGATTNFDNDIVFSDGAFVQYPEGTQN